MIKTLFNDNDEPIDCNFDKLQLMYKEDNGYNTIINHYVSNEDIEDASDHFQKTIRINDKNIDIDCEIAGLIDRLNNKSNNPHNSTKFCCSSHYMDETWLYDKPSNFVVERKAMVIYTPSSYQLSSGYILFNSINKELEKIIPLHKKEISIEQMINNVLNCEKPVVITQRFNHCTSLHWYSRNNKNVAKESVEYITKLIEPIL